MNLHCSQALCLQSSSIQSVGRTFASMHWESIQQLISAWGKHLVVDNRIFQLLDIENHKFCSKLCSFIWTMQIKKLDGAQSNSILPVDGIRVDFTYLSQQARHESHDDDDLLLLLFPSLFGNFIPSYLRLDSPFDSAMCKFCKTRQTDTKVGGSGAAGPAPDLRHQPPDPTRMC